MERTRKHLTAAISASGMYFRDDFGRQRQLFSGACPLYCFESRASPDGEIGKRLALEQLSRHRRAG